MRDQNVFNSLLLFLKKNYISNGYNLCSHGKRLVNIIYFEVINRLNDYYK